jgi:transcriptional regulator with XRE-family HTH domain
MALSLAEAVGRNVRELRLAAGVTLEQLAAAVRPYGLSWSSGRVGDLEAGRVAPTIPTLYAVTLALHDVTGQRVTFSDLFKGPGDVVLNDALEVHLEALRQAVSGLPPTRLGRYYHPAYLKGQEADWRLAKEAGLDWASATTAMYWLWGKPYSVERDTQAGAGASPQRKGHIARRLRAEFFELIATDEFLEAVAENAATKGLPEGISRGNN